MKFNDEYGMLVSEKFAKVISFEAGGAKGGEQEVHGRENGINLV
jgi:hypothetical protein